METKYIKKFKLIELIGTGGMSNVYMGRDETTGMLAAVKIFKSDHIQNTEFLEKYFNREIKVTKLLNHKNIVKLLDYGSTGSLYYLIYELIQGVSLDIYAKRQKNFSISHIEEIAIQILDGLNYAHNKNIVHRDIKPKNILVTYDGMVKLADFGISKLLSSATMTETNAFIGSPHYISPEQAEGKTVGFTTDIYSFGILLYELIAGKPPFIADNPWAIVHKHLYDKVPDIRDFNNNVPVYLIDIFNKCLEKDPDRRFNNVKSIVKALSEGSGKSYEFLEYGKTEKEKNTSFPVETEIYNQSLQSRQNQRLQYLRDGYDILDDREQPEDFNRGLSLESKKNTVFISKDDDRLNDFSKEVTVIQKQYSFPQHLKIKHISNYSIKGANRVYVENDTAFVSSASGFYILDVKNIEKPKVITKIELLFECTFFKKISNFLFLATENGELLIYELKTVSYESEVCKFISVTAINGRTTGMDIYQRNVCITSMAGSVQILNLDNNMNFKNKYFIELPKYHKDIAVLKDCAYIANADDGIYMIDFTKKNEFNFLKNFYNKNNCWIESLQISNNLLYASDTNKCLLVFDISNEEYPILIKENYIQDIWEFHLGKPYLAVKKREKGFSIYYTDDSLNFAFMADFKQGLTYIEDVFINNDRIFVLDKKEGLIIYKID